MEKRIKTKVDEYFAKMKEDIKKFAIENSEETEKYNSIIRYIYEYESLKLTTEDFSKRKRVKNTVPIYERCCAKRANGEQCTRRKKPGVCFCGTHVKGTPHGVILEDDNNIVQLKKVEVWIQEIHGK